MTQRTQNKKRKARKKKLAKTYRFLVSFCALCVFRAFALKLGFD